MSWEKIENNKKIRREFEFDSFKDALSFVNKVGELAEEQKHHPDILIFDYNNVRVEITTHDARELTDKDFSLAQKIDEL